MQCVIYKISNSVNNKVYIGSTINFNKRKNQHVFLLKRNQHHSRKLQNAWNKYGEESFSFDIVKTTEIKYSKEQLKIEQEYLDKLIPHITGYNMSSNSQTPGFDIVWTEKMKKEMGEKVSRKHKGKTPKNLESIREKQRRPILEYENGLFVKEYDSCKQAGEILNIDYKLINNIVRKKVKKCVKYPNKTWIYKDGNTIREIKKQQTSHNKGKYKKILQYDLNDIKIDEFESADLAGEKLNVHPQSIMRVCRSSNNIFKTLKCKFKYEVRVL